MRAFLDANVIFSAALSPLGRARSLFEIAADSRHSLLLLASPHAVAEAERNLLLKYPDSIQDLRTLTRELSLTAEATPAMARWAHEQGLPLEDAPILAAAVRAHADLLITGDRAHFGHLYGVRLRGVLIVSPATALARVLD